LWSEPCDALTTWRERAKIEHVFLQASLFGVLEPEVDVGFGELQRIDLDATSWVDHAPRWLSGADGVFGDLLASMPWKQRRNVRMYDSLVDEPRLTSWWRAGRGSPEPLPLLATVRQVLSDHYDVAFDSIGFNLYRNGDDSVAWHGDRHRHTVVDPIVAILSVGEPRPLRLRPRGGGPSRAWDLGAGDLFVMGGACQHDWEHCVPKLRRHVGPRMSITFRHDADFR
jgi:alkylated DNA repair dioxygenase AlkB